MENSKIIKLLVIIVLSNIINLALYGQVFGYEIETHEGITKEAASFYNQAFPKNQLSAEDIAQLISGARHEDDDPRYFNHYYDPIHNTGLTAVPGNWLSSKAWSRDKEAQISALYNPIAGTVAAAYLTFINPSMLEETDFTWERIIRDYVRGDKNRAMFGLGHIMHLIEDASVPDHTRNDPHIALGGVGLFGQGSPYELWCAQFNKDNINLAPYLYFKKPIVLNTLDEYFDGMANYSNRNFYSKDTIDITDYSEPKPDYKIRIGEYVYGYKKDKEVGDYKLVIYQSNQDSKSWLVSNVNNQNPALEDTNGNSVISDYWERLAPKAVQYSAGVIDLFFREVEKTKQNPNFNKPDGPTLMSQAIEAVKNFFGKSENADNSFQEISVIPLTQSEHNPSLTHNQSNSEDKVAIAPDYNTEAKTAKIFKQENSQFETSSNVKKPVVINNILQNSDPAESLKNNNKNYSPPVQVLASETSNKNLSSNTPSNLAVPAALSQNKVCSYETTQAASREGVIINELAWSGTDDSSSNEWMELRNASSNSINLSNWQLIDKGDQIHITFSTTTTMSASALMLLERTDDATVPGIKADHIYVGALGNSNEGLRLFDGNCALMDEVLANPDWPAGGANPKRSMERGEDLSWHTYNGSGVNGIFGTPKAENTRIATSASLPVSVGVAAAAALEQSATTTSQTEASSSPATPPLAPAPPSETQSSPQIYPANHVVISEVNAGVDSNSEDEFVELYNPTNLAIDIKGWSLKKKTSSGTESALVSKSSFVGIIPPKGFFLIAHEKYTGQITPDLLYSANSLNLAYASNTALIYDASGGLVDGVSWVEIKKGGSIERKAVQSGACVIAATGGGFLGNACDRNLPEDFDARETRDPQNTKSLPEPRVQASITGLKAEYNKATLRVAFAWDAALDARAATTGISYRIYEITPEGLEKELARLGETSYDLLLSEIGRDYKFSVRAVDREGLISAQATVSISVPTLFSKLDFYKDKRPDKDKNYLDISFDNYPFIPSVFRQGPLSKIMVFYLNSDTKGEPILDTPMNWQPSDRTSALSVHYNNVNGENGGYYSLILPDSPEYPSGKDLLRQKVMTYDQIEDGKLTVWFSGGGKNFTPNDYVTIAFYDFAISGNGNQGYQLLAVDKTRYYFQDPAPLNLPTNDPLDMHVDTYLKKDKVVYLAWKSVTDPDGLDRNILYQVNVAKSDGDPEWVDDGWYTAPIVIVWWDTPSGYMLANFVVERGKHYIFGARAIDERGNISKVATSSIFIAD